MLKSEKGTPTVAGKSKSESKDKEKKHKKHKDKEKDKEHKKHKHRHKDRSKDKDKEKKKDRSGHHDSVAEHSKKHHEKVGDIRLCYHCLFTCKNFLKTVYFFSNHFISMV